MPALGCSLAAGPRESGSLGPGASVLSLDPRALERLMAVECLKLEGQVQTVLGIHMVRGRIGLSSGSPARIFGGWDFCRFPLGPLDEVTKTLVCPCLLQMNHTHGGRV